MPTIPATAAPAASVRAPATRTGLRRCHGVACCSSRATNRPQLALRHLATLTSRGWTPTGSREPPDTVSRGASPWRICVPSSRDTSCRDQVAGRSCRPPDPCCPGVLWLSMSSWSAKGTQTIVLLVLARALTPADFGVLAVAALTYNVLLALNHLGVSDALTFLRDRVDEAARTALTLVIAGGLVLMGVTWVFAPAIGHFFNSPDASFVLRGFALGIPFDAAAQVPIGRLTRSLSFGRRTMTDAVPSAIGAAVTIGVVVSGHPLIGLVAGQIVGSIANAIVAMLIGPRCLPGWNARLARQLLKYGKYLSGADIVNLGLLNVDYVIVGHVLGPVALGYYSLAYRICFMPYVSISVVANGALFPYYCRLPSEEAKARTAEAPSR